LIAMWKAHWGRGKLVAAVVAFAFLIIAAACVGVMAFGPTSAASRAQNTPTAQPAQPSVQRVEVIVTKSDQTGRAEALVKSLDGVITKDLSLINAFAAEIPAGALAQLAAGPGVAQVTPDGAVENSARKGTTPTDIGDAPLNYYRETLGISGLPSKLTGAGVGVAVIDSGIYYHPDYASRIKVGKAFTTAKNVLDKYGHGTHVAGIIAGDGTASGGLYTGVAPGANLIALKIADDQGNATESDVVAALQWVNDHKAKYNIRVVNLSVNSSDYVSYDQSPLDAACEILWFNGVVVVTSAGNKGMGSGPNLIDAAPANDPFVITVGASDENGTSSRDDDRLAPFSTFGVTLAGFAKPEIVAPGTSIYSTLSSKSSWGALYPDRVQFGGQYFRLSGTSMSAPMVSGVVALLLQDEPKLTPDQVKYRLIATAPGKIGPPAYSAPYLDAKAAINGTTTQSANTGIKVSDLLTTGENPVNSSVMWNSVMWNSVMWNSVMWNSVMWNSVMWNSVMWNSVAWK
jgi:serine protease AprX